MVDTEGLTPLRGSQQERPLEFCRACRDEHDEIVPADFILWGKLLPPEHLGPRCYAHTASALPGAMSRIDQYAVFDLRKVQRVSERISEPRERRESGGVAGG